MKSLKSPHKITFNFIRVSLSTNKKKIVICYPKKDIIFSWTSQLLRCDVMLFQTEENPTLHFFFLFSFFMSPLLLFFSALASIELVHSVFLFSSLAFISSAFEIRKQSNCPTSIFIKLHTIAWTSSMCMHENLYAKNCRLICATTKRCERFFKCHLLVDSQVSGRIAELFSKKR